MSQEAKIVARTFELDSVARVSGFDTEDIAYATNDELTLLAGKAAGVCYMPDDYFENGIQNEDKAFARAEQTAKSGHHSVYDHGHITMVLKTNKMMAMILNSLGVYATSEKSARYTKMQPETDLELQLYEKWKDKIQKLILNKYPDTDDSMLNTKLCKELGIDKCKIIHNNVIELSQDNFKYLEGTDRLLEVNNILDKLKGDKTLPSAKLAQENARYMISVFTPTTMLYTVSFRQLQKIVDYLNKLVDSCGNNDDTFSGKLIDSVSELKRALESTIGEVKLQDNKNQNIRFLEYQVADNKDAAIDGKTEVIGDSYTLVYGGSLAMLAQAQRHRTIRYTMFLRDAGEYGWYVPAIVDDAGLADEWLEDISSVAYCVPQGTMVRITEQGIFEDFALKCKERMCGRAQLEIMHSTTQNIKKFTSLDSVHNLCNSNKKLLENITVPYEDGRGFKPCARCQFKDFKCSEGCQWGAKNALTRLI